MKAGENMNEDMINEIIECLKEDNQNTKSLDEKEKEAAQKILNELQGYRVLGATRILEFCIEAIQCMYITY